jgi:hypothetical protein
MAIDFTIEGCYYLLMQGANLELMMNNDGYDLVEIRRIGRLLLFIY